MALASATIHQPPLLFLDEPTAGVDPVSRREFWDQIHRLASEGTTVLLTTHYMDEAERCHRLAFIFGGRLLRVGTPEEIIAGCGVQAVELQVEQPREAAELLRQLPGVEEVAHYGHLMRVATRGLQEPVVALRRALALASLSVKSVESVRITVEDAFVATVRAEANKAEAA